MKRIKKNIEDGLALLLHGVVSYLQVYRDNYVCKPYDRRECKFYHKSPKVLGKGYDWSINH